MKNEKCKEVWIVKYKYKIWMLRNVIKFEWWNINIKDEG